MKALAIIELITVLLPIVAGLMEKLNTEGNSEEVEKAEAVFTDLLNAATLVVKAIGR